jgi:hypothetical protein
MKKRKPLLEFTNAADRDIERCILFHCLNIGRQPYRLFARPVTLHT